MSKLSVIYEDNHLLAVVKPAGLPTMGVASGKDSLLLQAKEYLKKKYDKPGNVYLGTVSRLDAPVTGVTLFARTSKAAARLSEQFRKGTVEKQYWAVVAGKLKPKSATLVDHLKKHERHRKVLVVDRDDEGAQRSELEYQVQAVVGRSTFVQVTLITGRKHQIRVQLAHRGHPIVGDQKYGSKTPFAKGIALHARRLVVEHPVEKTDVELVAPLPKLWHIFNIEMS